MSTNNKDDDDDNGRQENEKVRKKEICQIPSIKSIFSVFG